MDSRECFDLQSCNACVRFFELVGAVLDRGLFSQGHEGVARVEDLGLERIAVQQSASIIASLWPKVSTAGSHTVTYQPIRAHCEGVLI
jgi:hypothetical protein